MLFDFGEFWLLCSIMVVCVGNMYNINMISDIDFGLNLSSRLIIKIVSKLIYLLFFLVLLYNFVWILCVILFIGMV